MNQDELIRREVAEAPAVIDGVEHPACSDPACSRWSKAMVRHFHRPVTR